MTTHVLSSSLKERWLLYDASKFHLGRLAAEIALNLMGKDMPTYQPDQMNGAFVVVVNAEKIQTTGRKAESKEYFHYSGYPGGRKGTAYAHMLEHKPEEILRLAVKRMLPKNNLGRDMMTRLKVYAGPEHPHKAQQPVTTEKIRK